VQWVFGGVSAKQIFKRHHKTAAIIDKTFRIFTCPLFDTPMVENRRVKHSAILHAQMNCFTPLHKGLFDHFHIYSFRAAERFALIGSGVWAGVDNVWEQEKLEARKMLENAAESHQSAARFVRRVLTLQHLIDNYGML